ncbi:hypothetical protein HDU82_002410 [Entophlyctis luteolus]|nr:hypothetical protein HDU82_002410 [Entophlyctis luteolus]
MFPINDTVCLTHISMIYWAICVLLRGVYFKAKYHFIELQIYGRSREKTSDSSTLKFVVTDEFGFPIATPMVEKRLPGDTNTIESNDGKRESVQSTNNVISLICKVSDELLKKHVTEATSEKFILGRIERLHWLALAMAVTVTVVSEIIAKTHRIEPEVDIDSCMFDYDYSLLCALLLVCKISFVAVCAH